MLLNDLVLKASDLQVAGVREKSEEKVNESQRILLDVINQAPDDPGVLFLLANTYLIQGYNGLSIALLRRALCMEPSNPAIHCNLASAYKGEEMNEHAERHLIIANAMREDSDYLANLAALWVNRGHPERGIPYGERALDLCSTNAKAAWNLALLRLENLEFDKGFAGYLSGIDSGDRLLKPFYRRDPQTGEKTVLPMWRRETGRRVVVYGEQGIGDEILFASAIEDLSKECESLVIDCHPRLVGCFRRSFADLPNVIAVHGNRKEDDVSWAEMYDLEYRLPMGNLFHLYRGDGKFPRKQYLTPDPEKMESYRKRLEALGPGPYIGFSWAGGSKRTHTSFRSAKLGTFRELFDLPATFVSLQYTDVGAKIDRFNEGDVRLHSMTDAVKAFDYDETIALIGALDLVVSVCTAVVHVAGAIGKQCLVMTPFQRAWRYAPSMRMYQYGDWVWQHHKGETETWEEYVPGVVDEVRRWLAAQ